MDIAKRVKAFFTSTISTIIYFIYKVFPIPYPRPPSSSSFDSDLEQVTNVSEQNHSEPEAVAVSAAPAQNPNSELETVVARNVSEQNPAWSHTIAVTVAPDQNRQQLMLEWQKAVMAFCFTSALGIAVLSAQIKSELPFSFHLLSFAILLIFLSLFVVSFIDHNFTTTSLVLENVAFMLAFAAVVFTITIPFPQMSQKCVIWSLSAISLFTILICRY